MMECYVMGSGGDIYIWMNSLSRILLFRAHFVRSRAILGGLEVDTYCGYACTEYHTVVVFEWVPHSKS